ncbi:glycosyltransferase family 2 protein [Endozoicomonas sp. OPT23]|uniref:glycosyltransferase family 2 protein n=1 Tax=Endozoicomonas sp. OPT23 TaxID=2072845 RepID=UPI001891929E|nr:glycosyltransferase family 2 protein [Endozoicomonas sp. OPT23]
MSDIDRSENASFILSCVVPVFNEGPVISQFLEAMQEQLAQVTPDYEIIVIDDGSSDDTVSLVEAYCCDPRVKLIELSRNFGKETALTAGIDATSGDAVVLIDADFQHPLEMIPVFVDYWRQGYQMVYGVRQDRDGESFLKKKGAQFFYRIMHSSTGINVPAHAGDFRLMDRVVVDALKSMPERNRFMKGIYAWVGYKTIGLPFQVRERLAGESGWGLAKLTGLALSGITAFTTLPLRIVGAVGLLISIISFFYAFFIISKTLILGTPLPGWPTVIVAITFIGGIQLLSLWVLGEYVAGIFNEVKQRPRYLIQRTLGFKGKQDTDAAD